MSMPNFPEGVLDITCDQAFHMLLGSIAMEELALSHIMNAEGEKLQYVLGTLPGKPGQCATTKEVMQVNRGISDLLEKVAYNQILLKGKLQQVLEARESCCPSPPCPPQSHCTCGWTAEKCHTWSCGCPLPWKQSCACGEQIAWQKCSPALVYLAPQHTYFTSFHFSLRTSAAGPVRIVLREAKNGAISSVAAYEACSSAPNTVVPISGCIILPHDGCKPVPSPLQFVLEQPQSVIVEQATWTIVTA